MTDHSFGLGVTATDDGPEIVVCREGRARSLSSLLGDGEAPSSLRGMLGLWDEWIARIEDALAANGDGSEWSAVEDVRFGPPVPDPSAIYCAGANFYDHVVEMSVPPPDKSKDTIFHFLVAPASLTGHGEPVNRPDGITRLDWEVELVAVMGRKAWRVSADEALDYVAGYTVVNDISVREKSIFHEIFGVRWIESKGQATMNPIGPTVVPSKFIADPMHLDLSLHVNGEVRQQSNTNQMIWSLQEQIEALSHKMRLEPGDLILTGTPAGTAAAHGTYLADGDEMTATVEGVGTLVNRVAPTSVEDTGARDSDGVVPLWT